MPSFMVRGPIPLAAAPLDAATIAWAGAVVGMGGTVSDARKTIDNNLIVGLKTDGVWDKLDRLWLLAAENTQSALVDIIAADTSAAVVGAPTFTTDRGFTFSGTSDCINTGFNPATAGGNWIQDSAHVSAWAGTTNAWALIGHYDGTGGVELAYYTAQWQIGVGPNDNTPAATGLTTSTGLAVLTRTASNVRTAYLNGSASPYSDGTTSTGVASAIMFIGAIGYLGGGIHLTIGQIAAASIGGGLTATDVANLYSRLRTYMTAIGIP